MHTYLQKGLVLFDRLDRDMFAVNQWSSMCRVETLDSLAIVQM